MLVICILNQTFSVLTYFWIKISPFWDLFPAESLRTISLFPPKNIIRSWASQMFGGSIESVLIAVICQWRALLLWQWRTMSGASSGGYAILVVETPDRKLKLYGRIAKFYIFQSKCSKDWFISRRCFGHLYHPLKYTRCSITKRNCWNFA